MKKDIHPQLNDVKVTCSCGHIFATTTTRTAGDMSIDVCAKCHPFFTGKQKLVDTSGQVEKFRRKFGG